MKPVDVEQFGGGELWPQGREQMAQDGDVARIWREIKDARWGFTDLQAYFSRLSRSIEAASHENPEQFAADQMSHLVGITADINYRAQFQFLAVMSDHDRRVAQYGADTPPSETMHTLLPRMTELHRHFAELIEHQARIARLREVTREKKRKNDRAEQRQRHRENAARHDIGVKLSAVPGRNGSVEAGR